MISWARLVVKNSTVSELLVGDKPRVFSAHNSTATRAAASSGGATAAAGATAAGAAAGQRQAEEDALRRRLVRQCLWQSLSGGPACGADLREHASGPAERAGEAVRAARVGPSSRKSRASQRAAARELLQLWPPCCLASCSAGAASPETRARRALLALPHELSCLLVSWPSLATAARCCVAAVAVPLAPSTQPRECEGAKPSGAGLQEDAFYHGCGAHLQAPLARVKPRSIGKLARPIARPPRSLPRCAAAGSVHWRRRPPKGRSSCRLRPPGRDAWALAAELAGGRRPSQP